MIIATALIAFATAGISADDVDVELASLKEKEPPVEAVQQQALKSFGVHPDRVQGMRTGAAWKAAIPTLEVSGGATGAKIDDSTILDEYDPSKPWVIRASSGNALEVRTTLAWDLPRFIYNPEELDVAGLAAVQKDVITKVTQVYYARRRVQLSLLTSPPKDAAKKMAQELRVEELTAMLNGMTGGWFGEQIAAKAKAAARAPSSASAVASTR